ncbi:hypothetical protein Tco_0792168 [Tanacetum coccineum]
MRLRCPQDDGRGGGIFLCKAQIRFSLRVLTVDIVILKKDCLLRGGGLSGCGLYGGDWVMCGRLKGDNIVGVKTSRERRCRIAESDDVCGGGGTRTMGRQWSRWIVKVSNVMVDEVEETVVMITGGFVSITVEGEISRRERLAEERSGSREKECLGLTEMRERADDIWLVDGDTVVNCSDKGREYQGRQGDIWMDSGVEIVRRVDIYGDIY